MVSENAKTGHRHQAIEATRSSITGGNEGKGSPDVLTIPTTIIDVKIQASNPGGMNGNQIKGM